MEERGGEVGWRGAARDVMCMSVRVGADWRPTRPPPPRRCTEPQLTCTLPCGLELQTEACRSRSAAQSRSTIRTSRSATASAGASSSDAGSRKLGTGNPFSSAGRVKPAFATRMQPSTTLLPARCAGHAVARGGQRGRVRASGTVRACVAHDTDARAPRSLRLAWGEEQGGHARGDVPCAVAVRAAAPDDGVAQRASGTRRARLQVARRAPLPNDGEVRGRDDGRAQARRVHALDRPGRRQVQVVSIIIIARRQLGGAECWRQEEQAADEKGWARPRGGGGRHHSSAPALGPPSGARPGRHQAAVGRERIWVRGARATARKRRTAALQREREREREGEGCCACQSGERKDVVIRARRLTNKQGCRATTGLV